LTRSRPIPPRAIPFGNYYLLERLAVGGMAEVYLAKCFGVSGFDRLVALKRILPTIAEDDEFIAMFIDEAKIAGQLSHNNVAQIFDLGKINASYFIAMEYISGHDLRVLWDRTKSGGMPLDLACYVTRKICEGLDYAHRRRDSRGRPLGIIHRDVSPQNILLSYDGDIKVIDFGIAKAANRMVKTQTGILKGKFAYMAPEQAKGETTDHRADIFAIGVILYELLTGERAFKADTDFALLEKVRRVDVIPPRKLRKEIPRDLERIVYKALAQKASDRYGWASDMAADLDAFMSEHALSYNKKELGAFVKNAFPDEFAEESSRLDVYKAFQLEGDDDDVSAFDKDTSTAVHHHLEGSDLHDAGTELAAGDDSYEESDEDDYSDDAYSEEGEGFDHQATEAYLASSSLQERGLDNLSTAVASAEVSEPSDISDVSDEAPNATRVNIERPDFSSDDGFVDEATMVDDSPLASESESAEWVSAGDVEPLSLGDASGVTDRAQSPTGQPSVPSISDENVIEALSVSGEAPSVPTPAAPGSTELGLSDGPSTAAASAGPSSTAVPSLSPTQPPSTDAPQAPKGTSSLDEVLKQAPEKDRGPRPSTHPRLDLRPPSALGTERSAFDTQVPQTTMSPSSGKSSLVPALIAASLALVVGLGGGVGLGFVLKDAPMPNFIVDTRPTGARVVSGEEVICEKTPCTFVLDEAREVSIEKEGTSVGRVTRKLVPSKVTQMLRLELDEVKLSKKVESSPEGATVKLNGKDIGKTPVDLPAMLEGTEVQLEVELKGHVSQSLKRTIRDNADEWSVVELPAAQTTFTVIAEPKDAVVTPPKSAWGFPEKADVKVGHDETAGVFIERPGCKRKVVALKGNGDAKAELKVKLDCPPLDGRLTLRTPKVASVVIDGVKFSARAVRNYALPVGRYTLIVGYRGREEVQQVELKKGKGVTATFFR